MRYVDEVQAYSPKLGGQGALKPKCYRDYNLCLGICILQNRPEELPDVIRVVVDKKDVVFLELLL